MDLKEIIRQMLTEGYKDDEVYSFLKSKGHSDEEIRNSWANPADAPLGQELAAVGSGVWNAVKNTANTLGEQIKNNDFLGLAKGVVTAPYYLGKNIGNVLNAAGSPNMPAQERLQALGEGGSALVGLAPMKIAEMSLAKAFPKPATLDNFDILPPEATGTVPKPVPRVPTPVAPPPALGITQAIDPNLSLGPEMKIAPSSNPAKMQAGPGAGAQVPFAKTQMDPVFMPPDPNMPMSEMLPRSIEPLGKPGNRAPFREPSPLDMLGNERGMASPKWFEWFNKDNPAVQAFMEKQPVKSNDFSGVENTPIKPTPEQLASANETGFFNAPPERVTVGPGESLKMPTVQAIQKALELVGQDKFRAMVNENMAKRGSVPNELSQAAVVEETARRIIGNSEPLAQIGEPIGQSAAPEFTDLGQRLANRKPSARLQGIRDARNKQIMSDPEFRAKFMQDPERGAISPYGIYSAIKALKGNPWYQFKIGRDIAQSMNFPADASFVRTLGSKVGNFIRPSSALGLPFAQQEQ